jgi:hypothetical protein
MRKKGFALSIETIIYFLIALIALILLLWIFQDQAENFISNIGKFFGLVNNTVPK